jgi:predicted sulfurtransferase
MKKITYKWSEGGRDNFPKLKVKVKSEIVAFGAPDEITVDENGVTNGGIHLKPEQVNELVAQYGDDVIFYDGRNEYEAKIGKFKNAIVPPIKTSKEFINDIENGEISKHKDKPIVTYCTGGIRCEILSAMMKNRGYEKVYQVDGGIAKYGEKYGRRDYGRETCLYSTDVCVWRLMKIHKKLDNVRFVAVKPVMCSIVVMSVGSCMWCVKTVSYKVNIKELFRIQ